MTISFSSFAGAIGALTGDRYNPTGWIEPDTDAAEDVLKPYEDRAYRRRLASLFVSP